MSRSTRAEAGKRTTPCRAGREPSLLEAAAERAVDVAPDPALTATRAQLERALAEFMAGENDAKALGRYSSTISRIAQGAALSAGTRDRLVGQYLQAAAARKRGAGRQPAADVSLLDFLRHEINRERGITSWEQSVGARVPATEIAARAARDWGLNLTAEQVRKRLARTGRK